MVTGTVVVGDGSVVVGGSVVVVVPVGAVVVPVGRVTTIPAAVGIHRPPGESVAAVTGPVERSRTTAG